MYALMIYSLKVGACLAVFYLFFKLLLSRETFHRLNRIVVLSAMVLSFVLPLCVITVYRELPAVPELQFEETVSEAPAEAQSEPFPWDRAAAVAFLIGAGATLLWTLCSVCGVVRMIGRGRRERMADGSVLVRTDQPVTPFSWCRYIVLSEKDLAENGDAIVLHEKAHLKLRHSVDLLVTDLAGCLQWFNPAMWLLRRELRAIHEYEADEAVLDSGVDAKHYQLLLIRKAAGGRWYSVANSFNHSKLKNRITMMLRKKSSRWAVAKVLFVLPLTGLALGAFARTAYVFPDDKGKKENFIIHVQGAKIDASADKSGAPLFVVDGIEMKTVDSIPADRIATVTVLKDASSVALYGERAKNGVVVITTKDGGEGTEARTFSFDGDRQATKVVVRGAGTLPDSLKGKARQITYNIKGQRDSAGQDMVWTVNGRELDEGDMDALTGTIKSISYSKSVSSPDGVGNVIAVTTATAAAEAAKSGLEAAEAGLKAAESGLEAARRYMSAEEWKQAQDEIAQARKQLAEARNQAAPEVSVARSISVNIDSSDDATAGHKVAELMGQGAGKMENTTIVVRGDKNSFKDGEEPLFIIDGKVQNHKKMKDLNPDRIESISVLKDKSAVEKYGEKAKNGVIEITTKKK